MRFTILTIFPKAAEAYLNESLFKRARKNKLVETRFVDIRKFALGRHKKVDDKPFGGGPGMVMKIEPIWRALKSLRLKKRSRTILFSIRGKRLDANMARRLSKYEELVLICGRYEGVDERVAEHLVDEEISIGDYVLAGGELPALVLIEAVSRQLLGFLGKHESLEELKGSYKTYTRPEIFKAKGQRWVVPKVLLSGDHRKIEEWRRPK